MLRTLFNYNDDDKTLTVFGKYTKTESVTFDDIDYDVGQAILKSIRAMETEAYDKGVADVLGHVSKFRSER